MTSDSDILKVQSSLGRKIKGLPDSTFVDIENWPTPDEGAFSDKDRSQYLKRKLAVKMYLSGCSENLLREKYGIGRCSALQQGRGYDIKVKRLGDILATPRSIDC